MAESYIYDNMMGWDLVWENPDPTNSSGFGAQDVMLDLSSYSWVLISFRMTSGTDQGQYIEFPIDDNSNRKMPAGVHIFNTGFFTVGSTATPYVYSRLAEAKSDRVSFENGYRKITSSTASASAGATYAVPVCIWAR